MNLREFSKTLGLSPTTVSRALGGYPEVSPRTRRLVQEAAREQGYRPDRRAAALATGRAMTIGHVIPAQMGREMLNPVFGDFMAGAGEVYSAAGYDMAISFVPDEDELRVYRQIVSARSADGVIVHAPRVGDTRVPFLRACGLPFVVHGRVPGEPLDYPFVDIANRRAFRRLTSFLLDLGHRRVALVNGEPQLEFARRRHEGWAEAHGAAGLAPDPELVRAGPMSEGNGHRFAAELLALPDPPTAFVCGSVITAVGVRRAAHAAGLLPGRDVSIAAHDDMLGYFGNGEAEPVFTATRSSAMEAGRRCAEILLAQIARPDAPLEQEVWDCDLVLGASTGPLRAGALSTRGD
ncbi:substrate-binding domain-containing protein [Jannaschia sp. W003]|uniref:substrate-binding domain-containing protein n=1 Tax=Jannaschia sp. W003 TaxID=2867012 RepID=UPI0021A48DB9|nr:substrate-binding domain-containing protein [Jannaschia sp. W003]UWQ20504.1 substrate-binding domain-containing protein [Jannaschia sp. W003]